MPDEAGVSPSHAGVLSAYGMGLADAADRERAVADSE